MEIVELDVNIEFLEPEVRRKLLVPYRFILGDLHDLLQHAFDWEFDHLWLFELRHSRRSPEFAEWDYDMDETYETSIRDIRERHRVRMFTYLYDFGDCWSHCIRIGRKTKAKRGQIYPQLIEVQGRAPPEDCGGAWGYSDMIKSLDENNYVHREYEDESWKFDPLDTDEDRLKNKVRSLAKALAEDYRE